MQCLKDLLDDFADRIRDGEGTAAVSELSDVLRNRRTSIALDDWMSVGVACRQHPIQALLLQDPHTARALMKPRGYAGDAEMLDYVYTGEPPQDTTAVGRAIFRSTTGLPNGRSVVARRDLLAQRIDEIALERPAARVLSIACGHLREAQRSAAVANKAIAEFVAFDQDAKSLEVISREQSAVGVKVVLGSVTDILRRRVSFTNFDFVYAAGLFDYLTDVFSRRLIVFMAGMLRPGGRLLVANFTPDNHGRGYMECFMDWLLICRDEGQISGLLDEIEPGLMVNQRVYRDGFNNIIYLEIEKA
jgi:hypothetical protein